MRVARIRVNAAIAIAAALAGLLAAHAASAAPSSLVARVIAPPDDAKPMFRWWWFGCAVEQREILRELRQMKADGIGGVEMAFVYPQTLDDPARGLVNEKFLGPAMLEHVRYAQQQARKLGLRVDVTLGSGWPYGGPATPLAEAAGQLKIVEIAVPALALEVAAPKLDAGDYPVAAALVAGRPQHWDGASARALDITGGAIPPADQDRVALFFIGSHTRQAVKRASVGAEGWVLDPFSKAATDRHLAAVGEALLSAFRSTPPYAVFSDSLEVYGADWTPALPDEFKKRRGYDLLAKLPELVAGGSPAAQQIRHDWGKTLTELVNENYLNEIAAFAHAHHTKFRSQTYGEPAVTLSSERLADLAEGEMPQWREFSTLRWATSANHVFGRNVTSAETFTWLHSPVFRATPLDMKVEVDRHFLIGTNQVIGHGWPYSPPAAGEPGWSLYAAGAFNDHNPWHALMPDVSRYIQRLSYALRQGEAANQIALLLPTDDAWAAFSPGHVTVTGLMRKLVPPALIAAVLNGGYNVDFLDAEAIELVGGIHYSLLLLPPTARIPLATLQAIDRFVTGGGKLLAVGRAPSMNDAGEADPVLTALSQRLFSVAGKSLVTDTDGVTAALQGLLPADFALSSGNDVVGFIRRRLTDGDIYFVANTGNTPISTHVSFATRFKTGVAFDPDTGELLAVRAAGDLTLAPYESRLFLFGQAGRIDGASTPPPVPAAATSHTLADISQNWTVTIGGRTSEQKTLTDWTANAATRTFSGEVRYRRRFELAVKPAGRIWLQVESETRHAAEPPELGPPNSGVQAFYDAPIREAAIVTVNGGRAGSLWHPPYRVAIEKFLQPGANRIEITVYNTALNAWAAQPPRDYGPLSAKYGERFKMQDLDKVAPLPSGILGSVKIVSP